MIPLSMETRGAVKAESTGWRATWADLAPRSRRLAARMVDLVLVAVLGLGAWPASGVFATTLWPRVIVVAVVALLYEPVAALVIGTTPGKRLLGIEAISVWDGRALGRADSVRRALLADVQLAFPPLMIRNLAWLLWDPAAVPARPPIAAMSLSTGRRPWSRHLPKNPVTDLRQGGCPAPLVGTLHASAPPAASARRAPRSLR